VERAIAAAAKSFPQWASMAAVDRAGFLRNAAQLIRARHEDIARNMTLEQGKPYAEAKAEILSCAEIFEWNADEGRRLYGRVIPSRATNLAQIVTREPVGPVAAFTPWNFPGTTPARKISGALGAGCTCVLKPAEETPLTAIALVQALVDSGLPAGVLNVVFGDVNAISKQLLESPAIRKISFTGSTRVGRMLAEQAARTLKKATLELGGHAPVLVFDDADLDKAVPQVIAQKYRNAGQICIAPTRFIVQEKIYAPFLEKITAFAKALKVGPGLESTTQMGPLANARRPAALDALVSNAQAAGAKVDGGSAPAAGNFRAPQVVSGIPLTAKIMSEEPFGPVALVNRFRSFDEAIAEANRLPYGLASYVFTRDLSNAHRAAAAIEAGMVAINTPKVTWAETPFGGVKDSGVGSEGGIEGLEGYTVVKSVSLSW
jgi:succinate-semialdehyde dehydrogenase/glutarate-semialdehyde dehydrogenase